MINIQKRIELQEQGKEKIIRNNYSGIFEVCPRFGKTRTVLNSIEEFEGEVWISSPYADIKKNWIVERSLWKIEKRFTAICHKSLSTIPKDLDLLVIDEAQALSVNQLKAVNELKPKRVLLLSGYLGDKKRRYINYWLGEPTQIEKYSILQGIEDKIISDFSIKVVKISLNSSVRYLKEFGVYATEKEIYDKYTSLFEYYKSKTTDDFKFNSQKEIFARKRRTHLCSFVSKVEAVKKISRMWDDKKRLIFTVFNETADILSSHSYHAKSKKFNNLEKFKAGDINEMAVCNMVSMGITFPGLKHIIIHQIVSNSELNVQKILRACNLESEDETAEIVIFCYKNTVEEDWVKESLEGIPSEKVVFLSEEEEIRQALK